MGFAKYAEDNLKIRDDREYMRKSSKDSTSVTSKEFKNYCIVCKDCGKTFVFSAGSQRFYKSKGFNPPKRCKSCREARKALFNERK